jgi:hypothetical protein
MGLRLVCALTICLGLLPQAAVEAGEGSALARRASCTVVRYYVARYTASTAEAWARSHGATNAEIAAARNCLSKSQPAQTAQAAQWVAQ